MDLTRLKQDSKLEMWRYPRFFSSDFVLSDEDFRHAKQVLRMKKGDKAVLCDGKGRDYLCEFSGGEKFDVIESHVNQAETQVRLRLFQCLPKSDKFDFIVQKAVELGVTEIVPVISKRCVSRPGKNSSDKVVRWNKIAYEAAKQSGRGKVPLVNRVVKFEQAFELFNPHDLGIILYECGGKSLNEIFLQKKDYETVNVFVGSEGGFEYGEVDLAEERGFIAATLGKRIMRVDTASLVGLSVILNILGEF
ncbi:MAG: 16S rRNA (uracil(1498)-N(3))-methyltransferase [Oscillospiraceae bacterium]|nr:16S rRNA (uracil(1498)-N(3))-methyltransferase [Oscillospiraceae bacterium]